MPPHVRSLGAAHQSPLEEAESILLAILEADGRELAISELDRELTRANVRPGLPYAEALRNLLARNWVLLTNRRRLIAYPKHAMAH